MLEHLDQDVHEIDKRLTKIEVILDRLENNHLSHMETDMRDLQSSVKSLDNKMFFGIIAFFFNLVLMSFGVIGFLASLLWL